MASPEDDYGVMRRSVGAVWVERDVVRVAGPDAVKFLHGQLSQDLTGLGPGGSALSFLLQPQGKVDALVRVSRAGEEELLLDTDGGWGEAVMARLERFKLRVKCDLEVLEWRCLALRGPRAAGAVAAGEPGGGTTLVAPADWPGAPGVDLLGPEPSVPDGVPLCGADAYEVVRIEAGMPRMGAEMGERTIPAETGLVDRAVSFTKGCYTGQELVARIDSRGGNVPRRLLGVVAAGDAVPPPGAELRVEGREAGRLTSVGRSPGLGAVVALAYVRRDVATGAPGVVVWEGGNAEATVRALPLVS